MPALNLWGRKWRIAGDELGLAALCSIMVRIAWISFLFALIFIMEDQIRHCGSCQKMAFPYFVISLLLAVCGIGLELTILSDTMTGTPTEPEKRPNIALCLTCHVAVNLLQLGSSILGLFLLYDMYNTNKYFDDDNTSAEYEVGKFISLIFIAIVSISQLIEVISVGCCICLSSSSVDDVDDADDDGRGSFAVREKFQNKCSLVCKCLSCITCSLFGGRGINLTQSSPTTAASPVVTLGGLEDLQMVARVMTAFFHHAGNLDVVPSDVAAGLGLLRHEQRYDDMIRMGLSSDKGDDDIENDAALSREMRLKHRSVLTNPRNDLTSNDYMLMYEMAHYSRLALASYSWMIDVYMNPVCGMCGLIRQSVMNICCRDDAQYRFNGSNESVIAVMSTQSHKMNKLSQKMNQWSLGHCVSRSEEEERRRRKIQQHNDNDDVESCQPMLSPSSSASDDVNLCLGRVEGDGLAHFNESAILRISKLSRCEIAYADFSNDVIAKPYIVLIDKEMKAVVVTIRGTLSLEDCITDAQAEPSPLDDAGREWGFDGSNRFAHAGILRAADAIRRDLRRKNILTRLFSDLNRSIDTQDQSVPFISSSASSSSSKFSLVVVGHSLGAGIAALLTLLLVSEFPSVKGFAYGIPGGLVDERTAVDMKRYLTSVILGNDLVCRLSFFNLAKLRESVLELLARCKVNKHQVFKSFLSSHRDTINQLVYPKDASPLSDFSRQLGRYKEFLATENYQKMMKSVKLIPPGLIVYLPKVSDLDGACCNEIRNCSCCDEAMDENLGHYERRKRVYVPTFADNGEFDEIIISPTMVFDHLPDRYTHVLESIVYEWMSSKKDDSL